MLRCATYVALGAALGALLLGETSQALAQGQALTVLRQIDADRYDPHRTTSRSAGEVVYMMADTLVSLDWDMVTIKPGLANSWAVSPDGLVYTFNLRDDVKFCDGRAMTADDVVYSLKRWLDPAIKSPVASRAGNVKEIRAKGNVTVEYELNTPYSELLFQLTQFFAVVIDKDASEKLGQDFGVKGFNATGPWCWVSWEPRNQLVLQRNPHYRWGPPIYQNRGPAQIERVVWRVVPEDATRIAALQSGQGHISQYVPYWAIDQIKANPQMQLARADAYFWLWFIGFKVDKDVVADPRVRRAMNMGVNQEAIAKAVFFGHAKPARTYIDPKTPDYDKSLESRLIPFDPEGARKLLDEAGWKAGSDGFREKDGKKLAPVFYAISNSWSKLAEAVQGDLRKIGVDLKVQLWDATVAWGKLGTQEFDAFGMSFPYVSALDAMNLYFRSTSTPTPNRMNWKNQETDKWLDDGRAALTGEVRAAAMSRLQQQLYDAAVWIPIVHEEMFVSATKRLSGVRAHGIYGCGLYKGLDLKLN